MAECLSQPFPYHPYSMILNNVIVWLLALLPTNLHSADWQGRLAQWDAASKVHVVNQQGCRNMAVHWGEPHGRARRWMGQDAFTVLRLRGWSSASKCFIAEEGIMKDQHPRAIRLFFYAEVPPHLMPNHPYRSHCQRLFRVVLEIVLSTLILIWPTLLNWLVLRSLVCSRFITHEQDW